MKHPFIGRALELDQLLRWFESDVPQLLISVEGAGGVGKTSLITELIARIRSAPSDHQAIQMVDFDAPHYRTLFSLRRAIAQAYGGDLFEEYFSAAAEMEELDRSDLTPIVRERAARREIETFQRTLGSGKPAQARRLLLVLDTMEKVQDTIVFGGILDLLKLLSNAVVVVVGRRNSEKKDQLSGVFGDASYRYRPVEPFDKETTDLYLNTTLPFAISSERKEKLRLLTEGRPILITLAVVWLSQEEDEQTPVQRHWAGARILDLPLEAINTNLASYRQEFQFQILDNVRTLESPLDWAIMYMALMEYPCSATLWESLLDLSPAQAHELMGQLLNLNFVRADYTLHDEMRELVSDRVWPYIDHGGELRKGIVHRLLNFAESRKRDTAGWPRWFQEAEILLYRLQLNPDEGYLHFISHFDRLRDLGQLTACQLLVQTIESPIMWRQLHPNQQLDVRIRKAQLYTFNGEPERMEEECNRILDDTNISDASKVNAYCAIAYAQRDWDPQASAANYARALELAKNGRDVLQYARVSNWAGQAFRRVGELNEAITCLQRAIDLSHEMNELSLMASAENNLAYVYRQLGDIDQATSLARMAYVQRQRLGEPLGQAYSHQMMGEIYRDINDLITAESHFLQAKRLASSVDAGNNPVAYANLALANLARLKQTPREFERYLDEGISIFERERNHEGLSQAYNEYGCEYRRRGKASSRNSDRSQAEREFGKALEYLLLGIDISRGMSNWYRLADGLADLSLLYRYWYQNQGEEDTEFREQLRVGAVNAAHEALRIARRHQLILVENRAIESLGDITYVQGKYFKAFAQHYVQACLNMSGYYRSSNWRFHVVFERVHRKLLNTEIPDDEVREIARYMVRRWKEAGKADLVPGFMSMYAGIAERWKTERL